MDATTWKQFLPKVLAYRKLKSQYDVLAEQMKVLKAEIVPLVEANGRWKDDVGYVRMVQRKPSVSFDNKALEALFQSVEAVRRLLAPHRRVKSGSEYLQIK